MWPFTRKETRNEIIERIFKLTDQKDYGMCSPPLKAQDAINELAKHFLGDDWYSTGMGNTEQINTEIVINIENMYPKRIKK